MYTVFKQNVNWDQEPIDKQGMIQYKWKPSQNGILKIYGQYNNTNVALFSSDATRITNNNNTYYANTTYQDYLTSKLKINAGISYSNSKENVLPFPLSLVK